MQTLCCLAGPHAIDRCIAFTALKILCRFRLGRQEDAHEYLIALLDAMHESSLRGLSPKPSAELALTSFIYRIFGGRIRSQARTFGATLSSLSSSSSS